MTLFMFAWPAVWYLFLIYVLIPPFIPAGGVVPTWAFLAVIALGTGLEGLVGLFLLRREGYRLTRAALRDRIKWRWPRGGRAWGIGVAVLVAALALSAAASPVSRSLAGTPAFAPPSWWPALSNPLVEVKGVADAIPDIGLKGNFGFVALYLVVGLINVFGEEIYYRGYLLPRMRGVFGRWDWVANGVLFTLKHVYQRWLYPGVLVGGLAFAFAAGPLGSLPLAMALHWIGNFLLSTLALVAAAFGVS
jgi:membrane protease YdiL (CAAX protease family)